MAESHAEAKKFAESGKIVVMGGITPGQTTDAVAAVLAERVGASVFINVTSVDGIYSADPKKDRKAQRFETLTPEEAAGRSLGEQRSPPVPTPCLILLPPGLSNAVTSRCVVLDGRNPENLSRAILTGNIPARS